VDFKIRQSDAVLDLSSSRAVVGCLDCLRMTKLSDKQVLLLSRTHCYIYDTQDQVFTEIDVSLTAGVPDRSEDPGTLMVLDLSNFNLGIFQYLIIQNPSHEVCLLDL